MTLSANDPQSIEAASELFTRTICAVRAYPDRFAAGLALIAERFSTDTLRGAAQADMDEIAEGFKAGRPIPQHTVDHYQDKLDSASDPMTRVGLLRGFIEEQTLGMDRAEAQAVLLLIAWVADDEPDFTIGLPALLESWITEHWKGRSESDRAQKIASQRELLRFLRHGLKHNDEWRAELAHVGKLAWNRMEAAGLLSATQVGAPATLPMVAVGSVADTQPAPTPDLVPLSDAAKTVYEILCSLPDTEARTSKQLVQELAARRPPINVDEQRIKGHIRKELESRGILRSGYGYFIPVSRRPTRGA